MYENIYKKKNWSSLHYKKYGCALKACHFILRSINAKMSSKVDSVFRTRSLGTAASGKRAFRIFTFSFLIHVFFFINRSCGSVCRRKGCQGMEALHWRTGSDFELQKVFGGPSP